MRSNTWMTGSAALLAGCLGLAAGCGGGVNEEGFVKGDAAKAAPAAGTPNFQSRAEYELYTAQKAAEKRAAGKGARKPAPK
jgi:hypothetical protein